MNNYLGYLAAYGWCFISAFSMLIASSVSQRLSPFILSFFTFTLATLFFSILNFTRNTSLWSQIKNKNLLSLWIAINISTFLSWGMLIYPLTYLQPTIVVILSLGINPITTVIINHFFLKKKSLHKLTGISVALLIVIFFLIFYTMLGYNQMAGASLRQVILSLICCCFAGIATSLNNIINRRIIDKQVNMLNILCVRFYLTIILSGIIGFYSSSVIINLNLFMYVILTTLTFLVCPLVLIQIALKKLEPLQVAVISPFMPVVVIVLQLIQNSNSLSSTTIVLSLVTWILVSLGTYWAIKATN